MIRCTITSNDYIDGGEAGVIRKLRAAGIPARFSFGNLRLCQVWSADGNTRLGYGRLEWTQDSRTNDTEFRYWPPEHHPMGKYGPIVDDERIVDVDAREITDLPRLT